MAYYKMRLRPGQQAPLGAESIAYDGDNIVYIGDVKDIPVTMDAYEMTASEVTAYEHSRKYPARVLDGSKITLETIARVENEMADLISAADLAALKSAVIAGFTEVIRVIVGSQRCDELIVRVGNGT